MTFPLRKREKFYVLESSNGLELASLDTRSITQLAALEALPFVRFEAAIDTGTVSKRRKVSSSKPEPLNLSINIFGPKSTADDVGRRLSKASAFLQHPKTVPVGIEYYNPQFLVFPEDDTDMKNFIGITNTPAWAQRIKISDEVGDIMDSLVNVATDSEWQSPIGLVSLLKE